MARRVTLGENASIFHDQSTGITICKGEVVELNSYQLSTKRVRSALTAGHLCYALDAPAPEADTLNVAELDKKFTAAAKAGKDATKLAKMFTLDQLKAIAAGREFELDDSDTKDSLVKDILDEIISQ